MKALYNLVKRFNKKGKTTMTNSTVKKLFEKMTIEEKIGQLLQLSADFFQGNSAVITGPMSEHHLSLKTLYQAGSVLGVSGAKRVRAIQSDYLAHSRLKIPMLFMADVVHGYQTIFPIPLALTASFDPSVMKNASEVAASEAAAGGVHVTFAPMVDLVRDPRWGRVMESSGEDPFLSSVMAQAAVKGFQGEKPLANEHIAACVKHFAAYGAPEAGREYNTVDLSEWRFREQYLPAYAKAIEAQVLLVMTSFNTLFGVPATANQYLMRDILRKELHFNGVLISDWDAIGELITHGVAGDLKQAASLALKAGVDIDMMSFAYAHYLKKATDVDSNTKKLIDESVMRILELKDVLGLFDDPYRGISEEREAIAIKTHKNLASAQHAAEQAMVLLKNKNHILPLKQQQRLAVVGPAANTGEILGSWSWQGDSSTTESYISALRRHFLNVSYAQGCGFHQINLQEVQTAMKIARNSDVIVAFMGLPQSDSGEATSMTNLCLPKEQLTLLARLSELNKPMVIVVNTGRPLVLTDVDAESDAMLISWFPGSRGAEALANILDGTVEPSGKLPMTFPRKLGQIPVYYNAYSTGRPIQGDSSDNENKYLSKYIDESNEPLYPFGFGLTYADLIVTDLRLNQKTITPNKSIHVMAVVKNRSDRDGLAVVQCYIHQKVGQTVRPIKQLIDFIKVIIPANSTKTVEFNLTSDKLVSVHSDLAKHIDVGEYIVMVGLDSEKVLKDTIFVKQNIGELYNDQIKK
ncbi:beta-glucosidase [Lacticaseibacillus paracasei NRIC 1917]|uniref:beta-glucosidase n=2 Tax=Lacticaseibacillus paracasei TaxID=1597 RepID=A0A0C9Q6B3_LACPA|nr:beta-glucosidase [Lacticaseibacillus paracasei NRIC 0644]GAN38136.1 beta-glucosidase [Lacticaseibacillus paracasei NRIC 1917]